MKIKTCPRCNSANINSFIGGISGSYKCNNCGYIGPLIIEKELIKKFKK